MRISNQTDRLELAVGIEEAVRLNCEAGFEAIDYTMYRADQEIFGAEKRTHLRKMKEIVDSYGVVFNQAHSPFPHYLFGEENREYNKAMHRAVLDSIEIAAELGASQIIVHPIEVPGAGEQEQLEFNLDLFTDFVARGRALGIRIAIENMWGRSRDGKNAIVPNVASTGKTLAAYIDAFDDPYVTACLDVGHSGLVGDRADLAVRALGHDRLGALHLHDNDFRGDLHTLPFLGKIDFGAIADALREIDYQGDLTFEADVFYANMPVDVLPEALKLTQKIGEYLRHRVTR